MEQDQRAADDRGHQRYDAAGDGTGLGGWHAFGRRVLGHAGAADQEDDVHEWTSPCEG
ncbi:hypothetical protein ACWF82_03890 [Nocardia sp. NPDC055053]